MGSAAGAPGPPRPPGRPARLSREAVVRAGLEIVRRRGCDALTLRAVAEALGAAPMSLYSHVHGKDDLLEAVADSALERFVVQFERRGPWTERIEEWMHSLRRELRAHPEILKLILRQHYTSPQLLRAASLAASLLTEAGLAQPAAAQAAQSLLCVAVGFVGVEAVERRTASAEPRARQMAAALESLRGPARALAARFVPHFALERFDELYAATVRRLIAGLAVEMRSAGKARVAHSGARRAGR